MILGSNTTVLRINIGSAADIQGSAMWADLGSAGTTFAPDGNLTATQTGTGNVTIVPAPTGVKRQIKAVVIRNNHASVTTLVRFEIFDGTNVAIVYKMNMVPGSSAQYDGSCWIPYDANGNILSALGTSAQGVDTNVQINDGGFVAGNTGFIFDKATNSLGLPGADTGIRLNGITNEPGVQSAGILRMYAKKMAGRQFLKWVTDDALDQVVQPALFGNNFIMYLPSSSTNGGGATQGGLGISWVPGGTVSHPTPSTGAGNQIHRTRYANVITTTNQTLGIIAKAAGIPQFWRGNAAANGGFFFHARCMFELYVADTLRIFIGLSDSTTAQCTLDIASMTGNFCAFAHDTTDGANVFWFITRNNTTTTKLSITGMTLSAGRTYDFFMWCKPNDSTVYFRIYDINAQALVVDSSQTNTLPLNTAFMGPEVCMSNGTANVTATTVALSIARVYIDSPY